MNRYRVFVAASDGAVASRWFGPTAALWNMAPLTKFHPAARGGARA